MTTSAIHITAKFLNDPLDVVTEYLGGLAAAHADVLRFVAADRIVVRADAPVAGKVGLVSGGGSGCEPLHTGFVGRGMLDAACPGEVFASPVPDQIMAAIRAVDGGAGVLAIVKNFSGEIMNFEMAAEFLLDEDIVLSTVVVNDDVALPDTAGTVGRRGLGGTVLVEKIAGAAAERGDELAKVVEIAGRVIARARTYGVALSSCTRPTATGPTFDLPRGQMELGVGIGGEPGRQRTALRSARDIAILLVDEVLADLRPAAGAHVLTVVNGLGGTPAMELYLLYGEIDRRLRDVGLVPTRNLVGSFVTSLDQAGAALTILQLDNELTELWDSPVHTAALRWGI